MSKTPPIPPDQRSSREEKAHIQGERRDRRDAKTGLESNQPGDADTNLREQGRQGNMRQNLTPEHRQQDR
jgi:hypothetical protein